MKATHRPRGEEMAPGVENRKHRRYSLALPLRVRVKKATWTESHTYTRDVAASGVSFTLAEPCEVGSTVEFDLRLPPEISQGNAVHIRCHGKVVRVERAND